MKWNKVVNLWRFFHKTPVSVADRLDGAGVWTMAISCGRHLGQVIDDVYGRIQSHNRC